METRLLKEVNKVLKGFPEYWENETLLKARVIDDIRGYKQELIESLILNDVINEVYSLSIAGSSVFKIDEFISLLRYKNYWYNSYTKFSNDIGLTNDHKYLKYNTDVVIDFPHKDCVLEGGMTTEQKGKKEIYYHSILAKDEIDMMFSPKVLTNVKRIDASGEHVVSGFNDKDNLILKGNNLIALHTIKNHYAKKVKLIYIDPPYNTGGDDFKYNDRFNHSTWLTFMKNRLEVAREFLSEDGSIWVNIDDNEVHYLKVLMDEIFGRENFVANVIWQKKQSPQNDTKYFSDMHDHILVFAKNKNSWVPNLLPRSDKMNSRYKNPDNDPRGPWTSGDLSVRTFNASTDYEIELPSGRVVRPPASRCWSYSKSEFGKLVNDNRIWFGEKGDNVPRIKRFLSEVQDGSVPVTVLWEEDIYETNDSMWGHADGMNNQTAKREVNLLSNNSFSTPKPEKLLQQIITIATKKGDFVLDFFMGSATTQAVSMKMDRHFIGIEQMNYIKSVSVPRLKSVIEGEQGGISKVVEWKGGCSFVYAELYELNHQYIAKIKGAQSVDEIELLLANIKESAFLDYKININRLTNEDSGFAALSLEEKKNLLIESLDANQMYLSYSEIDDAQYDIPQSLKQFNSSFHQDSNDGGELE